MTNMITFQPKQHPSIIKVVGVGGGGSNAVNHMFKQGITGVEFAVCNTDLQALESSPVPVKIEIGDKGGLGAGANPEVGRAAAEDSIEKVRELLNDDVTQMLFITAGMGGGTGTGAAPVIAQLARDLNLLTVGIVTLPFGFEGRRRKQQAEKGIAELKKHVDALLVISNDKLREQFGNLILSDAFAQADNVLSSAARGIAELITVTGYVNVDFEDVRTVIKNSGKAIMGSAKAEGENRAEKAIEEAMNSPLLDDNDITGATDILLYITTGEEDITMDEITEITDYVQKVSGNQAETIWGVGKDESLGKNIGITIISTGFDSIKQEPEKKVIRVGTLDNNKTSNSPNNLPTNTEESPSLKIKNHTTETEVRSENIVHTLEPETKAPEPTSFSIEKKKVTTEPFIKRTENSISQGRPSYGVKTKEPKIESRQQNMGEEKEISKNANERINKLRDLSINLRSETVDELENEPAYVRKNIVLDNSTPSEETKISRFTLSEDTKKDAVLKSDNSFLHDNVD